MDEGRSLQSGDMVWMGTEGEIGITGIDTLSNPVIREA